MLYLVTEILGVTPHSIVSLPIVARFFRRSCKIANFSLTGANCDRAMSPQLIDFT
jgi:hypothetical protein